MKKEIIICVIVIIIVIILSVVSEAHTDEIIDSIENDLLELRRKFTFR